jgi:hypothetical protein
LAPGLLDAAVAGQIRYKVPKWLPRPFAGRLGQLLYEPIDIGGGVLGENEAFNPGQHHQGWIKIGARADVYGTGDPWFSGTGTDKEITGVPYYFRVLW